MHKEQYIFILLQSTRAVACKNTTYINLSQDKSAFNSSRFHLFIYWANQANSLRLNGQNREEKLIIHYSQKARWKVTWPYTYIRE